MTESRYFAGLDLAQSRDFTALAVLEGSAAAGRPVSYAVRHLERAPRGTDYPAVCARVADLFAGPPLLGGTLAVDATGLGRPVVDLLRRSGLCARLLPVTITAGRRPRPDGSGGWRVPKAELVAVVQRLLGSGRLKVAEGLSEARALLRELADFRVTLTPAAAETFGAGSGGGRDDLVLALALAAWTAAPSPM